MTDELYPGQTEELRKRDEKLAHIDRAHSAVLPGALRDAFAGEPARAEGYTLQPVTLSLTANLERIKSPLLDVVRIMREVFAQSKESRASESGPDGGRDAVTVQDLFKEVTRRVSLIKYEQEQIAETVFIFIRPQKKVRQLLEKGRSPFREAAMEELGDKLHDVQMSVLQQACIQHYVRSFATIIGYGVPQKEGEVNFPAPSPSTVTGSGGG